MNPWDHYEDDRQRWEEERARDEMERQHWENEQAEHEAEARARDEDFR